MSQVLSSPVQPAGPFPAATPRRTASMCFRVYGVGIRVEASPGEILEQVEDYLPPLREHGPALPNSRLYTLAAGSPPCPHQLHGDADLLATSFAWEDLFEQMQSDMQIHVADNAPGWVFLHAGVVRWRDRGLLIPGRCFSGKSTLVAALLRAGATYYSDEFAVLDAQGRIHPYPRQLSLRRAGGGRPLRCPPQALGSQPGTGPLPASLVLLTRYQPGKVWSPRRAPGGAALLQLVRHCVPIRRKPAVALATLARTLDQAVVLQGPRGEADPAAEQILQTLQSMPLPHQPWEKPS